jgi:hypothetical protein
MCSRTYDKCYHEVASGTTSVPRRRTRELIDAALSAVHEDVTTGATRARWWGIYINGKTTDFFLAIVGVVIAISIAIQ